MKHIFEEYGDTVIQIIGGIGVITILVDLIRSDGLLHGLIVRLLENAC